MSIAFDNVNISQILIMPYKSKAASMAIILPSQVDGLDGLLTKLAEGFDLLSALKDTYSVKVQVTIPKFKIETEIDLQRVLPQVNHCNNINNVLDHHNSYVVTR